MPWQQRPVEELGAVKEIVTEISDVGEVKELHGYSAESSLSGA